MSAPHNAIFFIDTKVLCYTFLDRINKAERRLSYETAQQTVSRIQKTEQRIFLLQIFIFLDNDFHDDACEKSKRFD